MTKAMRAYEMLEHLEAVTQDVADLLLVSAMDSDIATGTAGDSWSFTLDDESAKRFSRELVMRLIYSGWEFEQRTLDEPATTL